MNLNQDELVLINIAIVVSGFVVPLMMFYLYAWLTHAIAWINDDQADMDDSWLETCMRKLLRGSYRDYFPHTVAISALTCAATFLCVLGYWLWPVRYIAGLVVAIFISMHALRWMARTAKSLREVRKLAHEHDEKEKQEGLHENLREAA